MISYLRTKSWIVWLSIIAAPFLLFCLPLIAGKVLYWGTPGLQFVPWREFAYVQLDQGTFPLWNPLNGMGAPLLANYQTAFYYPPSWILIIGHWLAGAPGVAWVYTLLAPLHLAFAGVGMAVLVRSIGVKPIGQIIAGLAFGMSGYFVARSGFISMVWTGVWMPWVLWAASGIGSPFSNLVDHKRWFWFVLLTTLMLLAGHAQLSWYILLFAGAWTFFGTLFNWGIKRAFTSAGIYIALGIAAALLASIQLVPTFEYLLQSHRSISYEYSLAMTYSFWPWRFLTFLNPDLFGNPGLGDYWGYAAYWEDAVYVGVIPLFLAIRTLRMGWPKSQNDQRKGIRFLWGMIIVSSLFALGANTPLFPWLFKNIPSFDLFQAPARWMIWTVTALCLLAGISTTEWTRPAGRLRFVLNLATFGCVAALIGAGIASLVLPGLKASLLRGFMIFAVISLFAGLLALRTPVQGHRRIRLWQAGIVLIVSLDLIGASLFLNSYIPSKFYKPDKSLKNNPAITSGRTYISQDDEYNLKFSRYLKFADTRLTSDYSTIRQTFLPNLNLLDGIDSVNNFDPLISSRYNTWMDKINRMDTLDREKALRFMGVSAWITPDVTDNAVVSIQALQPDKIIQGFSCAERAVSGDAALSRTIEIMESSDQFTQCIIVEGSVSNPASRPLDSLQITEVESGFDRLKFRVVSDQNIWLRIGMTWYPGWHAKVDGMETAIFHADYIYSGFQVPAGQHEVLYYYQPVSFIIGAVLTLVTLITLLVIGVIMRKTLEKNTMPGTQKP